MRGSTRVLQGFIRGSTAPHWRWWDLVMGLGFIGFWVKHCMSVMVSSLSWVSGLGVQGIGV